MNEIIFESSGNIEHFSDTEILQEDQIEEIREDQVQEEEDQDQEEEDQGQEEEDQDQKEEDQYKEEEEKEEKDQEEKEVKENDRQSEVPVLQDVVPAGNDINLLSDNQVVVVSENIISKPLNEYTVSESLQLYIFISLFVAGFVILVRRAVLKWS